MKTRKGFIESNKFMELYLLKSKGFTTKTSKRICFNLKKILRIIALYTRTSKPVRISKSIDRSKWSEYSLKKSILSIRYLSKRRQSMQGFKNKASITTIEVGLESGKTLNLIYNLALPQNAILSKKLFSQLMGITLNKIS